MPEQLDRLPHSIFKNLKIPFMQIRRETTLPIVHRRLQHYQIHVHRDLERVCSLRR